MKTTCIVVYMLTFWAATYNIGRAQSALQSQAQREVAWLTEAWTANSTQWRRLRLAAEHEVAPTSNRGQLLQRLRITAQKHPQDAQAQFRWAYAVYLSAVDGSTPAERVVPSAAQALSTVPSPHAYEYARLRFLLEAKMFPARRLRALGERLAKRDPNDYSVKYRLVKILDPGLSAHERKITLQHAHDLTRLQPRRATAHAALASIYFRLWLLNHNAQDSQQAIVAYNRYLQLAPKSDPFHPRAQQIIAMLRKGKP